MKNLDEGSQCRKLCLLGGGQVCNNKNYRQLNEDKRLQKLAIYCKFVVLTKAASLNLNVNDRRMRRGRCSTCGVSCLIHGEYWRLYALLHHFD